jgi:hypothetical protein
MKFGSSLLFVYRARHISTLCESSEASGNGLKTQLECDGHTQSIWKSILTSVKPFKEYFEVLLSQRSWADEREGQQLRVALSSLAALCEKHVGRPGSEQCACSMIASPTNYWSVLWWPGPPRAYDDYRGLLNAGTKALDAILCAVPRSSKLQRLSCCIDGDGIWEGEFAKRLILGQTSPRCHQEMTWRDEKQLEMPRPHQLLFRLCSPL